MRWFDDEHRKLAIVGAGRNEGRSYLTANLAVVFSQLGQKTLLVDADMRRPKQHRYFGVDNQDGLSTVLSGRTKSEPVKRLPVFVDLSILSAGPTPPNPQELLGRTHFQLLLDDLSQRYDIILIDTPASEETADATAVAVRAGGALVVVRRNRSKATALQNLCSSITGLGGQVVGTVLNTF
jgi:receptor protein-tyrosine kinase